jgi:starch synthase
LSYSDETFRLIKTVFTIHDLTAQGVFWRFDMHLTGLPWDYFTPDKIEFYGDLNLMKAGILYSDAIITVSPQYSKNIQTSEYGCGLEGILRAQRKKIHGILNGINVSKWDPITDRKISHNYDLTALEGKAICKQELIKSCGFSITPEIPIVSLNLPLTSPKGVDLFESALPGMMKREISVVLSGDGSQKFTMAFTKYAQKYSHRFAFLNKVKSDVAHKLIAGSDFLVIPSKFEPSGFLQMCAMRYGTIPILRAVGGQDDSVKEFDLKTRFGTGFKFQEYSSADLLNSIDKAIRVYSEKSLMSALVQNAMKEDVSWGRTAIAYSNLYETLLG